MVMAVSPTFRSDPTFKATTILSRCILRIPHLTSFLPEHQLAAGPASGLRKIDSVTGWGVKATSRRARDLALEDGFLRSPDLGVNGAQPLSLVVDRHGI
jgi:capsular polysaccharide export protein